MMSQTPRKRGRKRDLYTRIANGRSHAPQRISAAVFWWSRRLRNSIARASRCGLSNTDKKLGPRTTIRAPASLTTPTKLMRAGITPHTSTARFWSTPLPVKGQHEEDQDYPADQV